MSGIGCLADAFEQSKANMCALDCGFNQNVSNYQFQSANYYYLKVKTQVVGPTQVSQDISDWDVLGREKKLA